MGASLPNSLLRVHCPLTSSSLNFEPWLRYYWEHCVKRKSRKRRDLVCCRVCSGCGSGPTCRGPEGTSGTVRRTCETADTVVSRSVWRWSVEPWCPPSPVGPPRCLCTADPTTQETWGPGFQRGTDSAGGLFRCCYCFQVHLHSQQPGCLESIAHWRQEDEMSVTQKQWILRAEVFDTGPM